MFTQDAHKKMARAIKTARSTAGLTQSQLAKKLGYTTSQFVSNWERGASVPPLKTLPKIARHTKTDFKVFRGILSADFNHVMTSLEKAV